MYCDKWKLGFLMYSVMKYTHIWTYKQVLIYGVEQLKYNV